MCGVIGYRGNGKGPSVVMEGLKLLEYRGYDSWGIAFVQDQHLSVIKRVGKIDDLSVQQVSANISNIAIGHTRWATHGAVTEKNAHPHRSRNGEIAVVHNGIIENFQDLRNFLTKEGYVFQTDTDTEVIPLLIEHYMQKNHSFADAVMRTLRRLEGNYAVLALHHDTLIGGKNGSPLVFGIDSEEYFLASDTPAFLAHTKKAIFLEDDDVVLLNAHGYHIMNLREQNIKRDMKEVVWDVGQAKLGDFPHFMVKEIYEQKWTMRKAMEQDAVVMKRTTEMIQQAFGVFFIGCGTSYHACVSASYVFSKVAKKHVNVVLASEFRNYEHFLTPKTLVVAVSQSGETADVLDAVKVAKKNQCTILAIVNVLGSTLTRLADEKMLMQAGPEMCVLSTKSYTSQLTILMLLAYACVDKFAEGKALIQKVSDSVETLLAENAKSLNALAQRIKDVKSIFVMGRELAYPSALEGALKIKEVSYIHAEGFAGGELKHGTIALIEEGVPVIVLCTDATRNLIVSNAREVKARGAYIIGIGTQNSDAFDAFIPINSFSNGDPIALIIPIQLLAYYLALARGCDPDKPRNLAKSVTVK